MTLGHEVCGVVAKLGPGVDTWHVGDRVALLSSPGGPGFGRDGGYAAQVLAPVEELVAVPDRVSDAVAALATDAGITSYRAVLTRGRVQSGTRVGIIGLGGLGLIGAQIAVGVALRFTPPRSRRRCLPSLLGTGSGRAPRASRTLRTATWT